MKIGVCVADYDVRNDLPDLLRCLASSHEVVVLCPPVELPRVGEGPWQKRAVRARISFWNRCWLSLFSIFGQIPTSRDNFLQNTLFLLQKLNPAKQRQAEARLRFRLKVPPLFSFDALLRLLRGRAGDIDDLDGVLFITNVSSPELLAQVLREKKSAAAYVYSWDHAPKYDRFSRKLAAYFTWNKGVADDLTSLQGVPRNQVREIGATQLVCLRDYLNTPAARQRKIPFRYAYYGCAIAIPILAEQEVRLVEWLANELARADSALKLIVRPYPMLRDTTGFRRLRTLLNVVFDDEYRAEVQERAIPRADIFSKFNLQEHAEMFFHCGTTMGFEGAYFDAPAFFLAPEDLDYGVPVSGDMHITRFFRTYHNEKYLRLAAFPNLITNTRALRTRLPVVLADGNSFLAYNRAIRHATPLRSMEEIASALADAFKK